MLVTPAICLKGNVDLPGDKSISHRAGMLASIAEGATSIRNYAESADCQSTLGCMASLGVAIDRNADGITIHGVGKHGLARPANGLDCGNSGTTMRLLSGILAGQRFDSRLYGDASLQSRPMGRIIDPLAQMGSAIGSSDGRAPLDIAGRSPLRAIDFQLTVASAQVKSCVLLAGLYAEGTSRVTEPVATRDHTERMLRWFGVDVGERSTGVGHELSIRGDSMLVARDLTIPADISAGAFFMVAASCLSGSDIFMPAVGINRLRGGVVDLLRSLGARIEVSTARTICNEPVADIRVTGGIDDGPETAPVISGEMIAGLIDEIPIIAVLGTQLRSGIEVRDASELRVKETDRIAAVVENLKRMGATVAEFDDGFRVERTRLHGARLLSFGDHRIAMAFAVAGLMATGVTEIDGAECAAVSFPSFFETLDQVSLR